MNRTLPLQFMLTHGIGDAFIHRFADFVLHNDETMVERVTHIPKELCLAFGIKQETAQSIIDSEIEAELLSRQLAKNGISWVWLAENHYPKQLRKILGKESPPLIFYRGNLDLCDSRSVGFCGSRAASHKGLAVTEKCCRQLVEQDIVVVSGYAKGVDLVSHRTALVEKGKTIIILAEGITHFREKQEIHGLIHQENCLILSQFPPEFPWKGRQAMRRNSTIIALSDAMVLVESGQTGGTYAAGEECLRRHVPLFVIDFAMPPGPSAEANPEFIQRGGIPIRGNLAGIPKLDRLIQTLDTSSFIGQPQTFAFD